MRRLRRGGLLAVALLACCAVFAAPAGASTIRLSGEIECVGDACQPLPPEPADPTPGTIAEGPTNPPLQPPKKGKPRHRHSKHHHKSRHHRR